METVVKNDKKRGKKEVFMAQKCRGLKTLGRTGAWIERKNQVAKKQSPAPAAGAADRSWSHAPRYKQLVFCRLRVVQGRANQGENLL